MARVQVARPPTRWAAGHRSGRRRTPTSPRLTVHGPQRRASGPLRRVGRRPTSRKCRSLQETFPTPGESYRGASQDGSDHSTSCAACRSYQGRADQGSGCSSHARKVQWSRRRVGNDADPSSRSSTDIRASQPVLAGQQADVFPGNDPGSVNFQTPPRHHLPHRRCRSPRPRRHQRPSHTAPEPTPRHIGADVIARQPSRAGPSAFVFHPPHARPDARLRGIASSRNVQWSAAVSCTSVPVTVRYVTRQTIIAVERETHRPVTQAKALRTRGFAEPVCERCAEWNA